VLSRNYFLLENKVDDLVYMKKLNQKKVRWIVKEMDFTDGVFYRFSCQTGTAAEKIESTVSQKEISQRLRYAKKFLKS